MDHATALQAHQARSDAPHHSPSRPIAALTHTSAALPALDPNTMRLMRLLSDARLSLYLKQTLDIADWQVLPCSELMEHHLGWIDLQAGNARASFGTILARHPALASVLNDARTDTQEAAAMASLRYAVSSILLKHLIEALALLGIADARVAACASGRHPTPVCALRFSQGEQRFEIMLGAVDDSWIETIENAVAAQSIPFSKRLGEVKVPGRICLGQQPLSIDTLNALRPGDIVLRGVQAEFHALLEPRVNALHTNARWGVPGAHQLQVRVSIDGEQLTLMENPQMTYEIPEYETALADADTAVPISELDLPVRFEIDTVSLSVAQLSALRSGYVLELPARVSETRIRLVAYGQTIGHGELVSIGEQMGVRIVKMTHDHGSV